MKKNLVLLMITLGMISCSKDNNSTSINPSDISNAVVSGTWRITYYWDSDHEETSNFSNYTFTFSPGGALTAVSAGTTVSGSWSTGLDDSKTELVLNFSSPPNFVEISDDWEVIEQTPIKIRLRDVSGGNGGTDQLIFERN